MLKLKYIWYGFSILLSRGIEYVVILFLAKTLSVTEYGEFEYYKRWVELGSVLLSFGFPVLIQTYTNTNTQKDYFLMLGLLFSGLTSALLVYPLHYFNVLFLLPSLFFYSCFYHGGSILQSYQIVRFSATYVSTYKIIVALVLSLLTLFFSGFILRKGLSLIYASSVLVIPGIIYFLYVKFKDFELKDFKFKLNELWSILNSMLYVILESAFNIAFIYTDVLLLEYLVSDKKIVASYSFPLTISGTLMVVAMSIVQMDIEELKNNHHYISKLAKKVDFLLVIAILSLAVIYYLMINNFWYNYQDTFLLFVVFLVYRFFHCSSQTHNMLCLIKGMYKEVFYLSIITFIGNIILAYVLFQYLGVYGIAISTLVFMFFRFYRMRSYVKNP